MRRGSWTSKDAELEDARLTAHAIACRLRAHGLVVDVESRDDGQTVYVSPRNSPAAGTFLCVSVHGGDLDLMTEWGHSLLCGPAEAARRVLWWYGLR